MYRSQTTDLFSDGRNKNITTTWRAVASYVTGRQSFKLGYTANQLGDIRSANRGTNDLRYRTNNGIPNQLTELHPQPAERPVDARPRRCSCRTSGRRAS